MPTRVYPYERFTVYGLVNPETDAIFYVGKTYRAPQRLQEHARGGVWSTSRTVNRLRARGLAPVMVTLDTANNTDAARRLELLHVARLLAEGYRLDNPSTDKRLALAAAAQIAEATSPAPDVPPES